MITAALERARSVIAQSKKSVYLWQWPCSRDRSRSVPRLTDARPRLGIEDALGGWIRQKRHCGAHQTPQPIICVEAHETLQSELLDMVNLNTNRSSRILSRPRVNGFIANTQIHHIKGPRRGILPPNGLSLCAPSGACDGILCQGSLSRPPRYHLRLHHQSSSRSFYASYLYR